jgi:3-oxoacyl-[acyl-carrier-protein] synthase II
MVFGEHSKRLAINSTKSMIGHGLGAAGAMEFVATVLSLREGKLHPTLNFEEADEGVMLDFVKGETRTKELRAALSNSFGFGGHNCSLCLKAWME